MSTATLASPAAHPDVSGHPRGLYVLFATEMWERFSFYSMLAMFTLYMRNPEQGFNWSAAEATRLYSNYLMFVYASPLVGGFLADRKLGYRRAVMLGGLFFMAGHLLLSFRSLPIVYAALACLVIGNGFFKPNVSTMVGNLYPEGSHLKDRAYNIFYMGINIGAFLAPLVAEFVSRKWGFHPAFAVAAFGMLISVGILWRYKHLVEDPQRRSQAAFRREEAPHTGAVTADAPPMAHVPARTLAIDTVPTWKRVGALVTIYLIVIVFWMAFHQNGSTVTYFADENTAWNVSGVISNAINPFWIITLTFPLVWFWKWLDRQGREPSTPMKMAIGMFLTATAFFILWAGARSGEAGIARQLATQGQEVTSVSQLYQFKVTPFWLISAYFVISLGELMLSPMGLSLVSKVAPVKIRGLMMGGWFVATAIGNKLTMIGVYWESWKHSSFFAVVGAIALATAILLLFLIRPLKKAMPGV
jgi:POT family proton-dependent oligopeptide transporter